MAFLSRSKIYKGAAIVVPTAFVIAAMIITAYVKKTYEHTENELIINQSKFAANEFAENLKEQFLHRVSILEISAESYADAFPKGRKQFDKTTPIIFKNTPGFLAVNWVDSSGHIRWTFPKLENQAAEDKLLLNRSDVSPYLLASKDERISKISHVVDLYQGPKGVVVYVPIYEGNFFRGWYNGAIDIEKFLNEFLAPKNVENLHFVIKWRGHENYTFTHGNKQKDVKKIAFDIQILNQTLDVEVDFLINSSVGKRRDQMEKIFISIYISVGIIALFLFYLIRSQFAFMRLNDKLTRDRTIINVLSHDMATPLMLITEATRRLKEKLKTGSYPDVDRILRSSEKQTQLLNRVRSFHATNIGKIHIELHPVSTTELISEALTSYEEAFKAKNITYSVEHPQGILYCLTDRVTAVNNVLGNVISNAIKFSEPGTKVSLKSYSDKKCVIIEISDQGSGIPKEVLSQLFDEKGKTSRKGTRGEAGTGLGMLQVKAFMEYYKGSVKIHSSEKGTQVQLYFRKADVNI